MIIARHFCKFIIIYYFFLTTIEDFKKIIYNISKIHLKKDKNGY